MRNSNLVAWSLFLLLGCIVGCSKPTGEIEGTAEYQGALIEDGMVTFTPTEGIGSIVGTSIKAGNYSAKGVAPGQYMVQVIATRKINFARSTEELAAMAEKEKAAGNASGLVDRADIIPANAVGNNQTVQVVAGPNKIDLKLSQPE